MSRHQYHWTDQVSPAAGRNAERLLSRGSRRQQQPSFDNFHQPQRASPNAGADCAWLFSEQFRQQPKRDDNQPEIEVGDLRLAYLGQDAVFV